MKKVVLMTAILIGRLILMFVIGFVTWSLALYRFLATEQRQVGLLCGLIFIEEFTALCLGKYLANSGFYYEAAAISAGGTLAAYLILRKKSKR